MIIIIIRPHMASGRSPSYTPGGGATPSCFYTCECIIYVYMYMYVYIYIYI